MRIHFQQEDLQSDERNETLHRTIVIVAKVEDDGNYLVAVDPSLNSLSKLRDLQEYKQNDTIKTKHNYAAKFFHGDTTGCSEALTLLKIHGKNLRTTYWPDAPFTDEQLKARLNVYFQFNKEAYGEDSIGSILFKEWRDRVRNIKYKGKDFVFGYWSVGGSGASKGMPSNVTGLLEITQAAVARYRWNQMPQDKRSPKTLGKAIAIPGELEYPNIMATILQLPPTTPRALNEVSETTKLVLWMYIGDGARTWRTPGPMCFYEILLKLAADLNVDPNYEYVVEYGCQVPDPDEYLREKRRVVLIVIPGGNANQFAMTLGTEGKRRIQVWVGIYGSGYVGHCGGAMYASAGTSLYRQELVKRNLKGKDHRVGGLKADELAKCFPGLLNVQYIRYKGSGLCPVKFTPSPGDKCQASTQQLGLNQSDENMVMLWKNGGSPFFDTSYPRKPTRIIQEVKHRETKEIESGAPMYPVVIDFELLPKSWSKVEGKSDKLTTWLNDNFGKSTNAVPVAHGKFGLGWVMLITNHPEQSNVKETMERYSRMIRSTVCEQTDLAVV